MTFLYISLKKNRENLLSFGYLNLNSLLKRTLRSSKSQQKLPNANARCKRESSKCFENNSSHLRESMIYLLQTKRRYNGEAVYNENSYKLTRNLLKQRTRSSLLLAPVSSPQNRHGINERRMLTNASTTYGGPDPLCVPGNLVIQLNFHLSYY